MSNGYIGQIRTFGFNFAPVNFAMCNGQLLSINQYTALYSLLGTTYGGDGVNTFGLPNLQSRASIHFGQGPGLSFYQLGQLGGTETVTLTSQQMPAHTHTFASTSTLNSVQVRASAAQAAAGSLLARSIDSNPTGDALPQIYVPAGTAGTTVALGGLNVAGTNAIAGGSLPHDNIQPYLALNVCIALNGLYPSRN